MIRNKERQTLRRSYRFYPEDIEYLNWLCEINRCTQAEMLNRVLEVYPQANEQEQARESDKPSIEAHQPIRKEYGTQKIIWQA